MLNNSLEISIVSPVYKASTILPTLVENIINTIETINVTYEIILIDDRSPDNSWEVMLQLSRKYQHLKIYRLSRNFGQHPAIFAGLSKTKGNWVVVMDCDMQDQPKEIIKLYNKAIEGYDAVQARRVNRNDSFFKVLFSKLFYKIFNYLAGIQLNSEVANYGIYNKKVITAILKMNDYIKAFPLFIKFVGFNVIQIEIEHGKREEGESSYNFKRLIQLAVDIIISYSDKPLKIFIYMGFIFSLLASFFGGYVLYAKLKNQITVSGYTTIVISIWFIGGIIISGLGMIGLYLAKTFNQTKNRPIYIFDE